MLVLLVVALWFILRGDLFYVLPCVILFLCLSVSLALRVPRLEKRELISDFRTFVGFVLVRFCRFPLPLSVLEGLQFEIVALPGLFSYFFFILRGDLFYVLPCVILFLFFSPFSIAITALQEERASLGAFRMFVRFALVWFFLFPLSLGVW